MAEPVHGDEGRRNWQVCGSIQGENTGCQNRRHLSPRYMPDVPQSPGSLGWVAFDTCANESGIEMVFTVNTETVNGSPRCHRDH